MKCNVQNSACRGQRRTVSCSANTNRNIWGSEGDCCPLPRCIPGPPGPMGPVGPMGPAGPMGMPGPAGPAFSPELLGAVSTALQVPGEGESLVFREISAQKGDSITLCDDASAITLEEEGIYLILFQAVAAGTVATSLPLQAAVQAELNGEALPGLLATAALNDIDEAQPMSFSGLFTVEDAPATLYLVNRTESVAYSNATVSILKVG